MAHGHIAQQGGGLVVAGLGGFVHHHALGHHGDACHLRVGEEVPHALLLRLADQRAHVQVHGGGADAQLFKRLAQALQQGFVNQRVDQHARARRAGLPGVLHDGVDDHGDGGVQVGVGKDDLRAFAAQLQRHGAVALGSHLLDQRADLGAAGEADVVDAGVARQRVAHLVAVAGDDVERPGGEAHFGRQLRHADQRQARVFGGLDHAHIARRQRAAYAAAKDLHGVVPGDHMARDAVGLAPGEHAVAVRVGDGLAVELVARTGVELEVARQRNRVGPRLLGGLAAVALLQRRQLVRMLQDLGRELLQQSAAFHRGQLLPHRVVALAGCMHRRVDVVGVAALDLVEGLAVGRVDHRDRAARGRGHRGVGDVVELHGRHFARKWNVCLVFV